MSLRGEPLTYEEIRDRLRELVPGATLSPGVYLVRLAGSAGVRTARSALPRQQVR